MTKIPSWEIIYEIEEQIRLQDFILESCHLKFMAAQYGLEERQLTIDLPEEIKRNSYYVHRILHSIRSILKCSDQIPVDKYVASQHIWLPNHFDIPFNFDNFLSASAALIESPFRLRIERYLDKNRVKKLREILPNRNDPKSLFWRLNVLRNRAVHLDEITYTSDFGVFWEFSSNFNVIEIKNGKIQKMQTTLIDINLVPQAYDVIQTLIDDRKKSFMTEFFLNGKPSGAKKKGQHVKYFDKGMELVKGFNSISLEVLKVLDEYHNLCMDWYLSKNLDIDLNQKFKASNVSERIISPIEIFKITKEST